jgi:DNA-directed RNA polymerase alpha subunit
MRRTLLGRVKGTCITCEKFEKVMHQYSTILSIQELVHDILINLKNIVFKSNSNSCKTKRKKKSIYFWTQRGNSSRYHIPTFC